MRLTPALKGQITKALDKAMVPLNTTFDAPAHHVRNARVAALKPIFAKRMPAEQAKHFAKKYVSQLN